MDMRTFRSILPPMEVERSTPKPTPNIVQGYWNESSETWSATAASTPCVWDPVAGSLMPASSARGKAILAGEVYEHSSSW